MNEPWFDANAWAWLPGTVLGIVGGVGGSLMGVLIPRGKGKAYFTAFYVIAKIAGLALAASGLVALGVGQPFAIWFFLLMPRLLTLVIFGPLGFVARHGYRQAELRRMQAQEFE